MAAPAPLAVAAAAAAVRVAAGRRGRASGTRATRGTGPRPGAGGGRLRVDVGDRCPARPPRCGAPGGRRCPRRAAGRWSGERHRRGRHSARRGQRGHRPRPGEPRHRWHRAVGRDRRPRGGAPAGRRPRGTCHGFADPGRDGRIRSRPSRPAPVGAGVRADRGPGARQPGHRRARGPDRSRRPPTAGVRERRQRERLGRAAPPGAARGRHRVHGARPVTGRAHPPRRGHRRAAGGCARRGGTPDLTGILGRDAHAGPSRARRSSVGGRPRPARPERAAHRGRQPVPAQRPRAAARCRAVRRHRAGMGVGHRP